MSACQTRRTKIAYPYWRNRATLAMSHIGHENEPENTRRRIPDRRHTGGVGGRKRPRPAKAAAAGSFSSLPRAAAGSECAHPGTQNMIERLLLITCAAYLVAASPAYSQNDPSYHDWCGGDSCASDAYDLGYHDGYEVTPTHHH
jgi:hypothetical protein